MHSPALVASVFLSVIALSATGEIDNKHLKCLVCRAMITEVKNEISKVDPERNIDVGNYRLDAEGNEIKKTIRMARSTVHLSDVLDNICTKLADYVRATDKSNGKLRILNLMSPSGGMNSELSKVDIVQDGDLNRSLEYLCGEVVEEGEEEIIEFFQKEKDAREKNVCTNLCDGSVEIDDAETKREADSFEKAEL